MDGQPHVLIIPATLQGHVAPLMKLAHLISDHGIKVTLLLSDFIHGKIVAAMPDDEAAAAAVARIRLVSVPDGLEPEDDRKDGTKLIESIERVMPGHLKDLIEKINGEDGEQMLMKIACVIADVTLGSWPMKVAEKMGIKWVPFCPYGPQNLAFALHIPKLIEARIINSTDGSPLKDELICVSKEIPMMSSSRLPWKYPGNPQLQQMVFRGFSTPQPMNSSKRLLCNSFYELDSYTCDLIPSILPIGPLPATASNRLGGQYAQNFWPQDSSCISWLDQQPAGSVIYIAFGSLAVLTHHQFHELALGIELAGRPFLWIVRSDSIDGSAGDKYPDGFIERVVADDNGKIVSWGPQEEVLAHPSVACFISHCGWNSTMDAIANGVPFLCWPCFGDQFINESYICKKWKVGLELNADENGFISRHEIKEKIERLVSDEGIKASAEKLKEMARKSVSEGGSSYNNFKAFIEAIKH